MAVGKRADLVVLNGNPLTDIRAVRYVQATLQDGRFYSRSLDEDRRRAVGTDD